MMRRAVIVLLAALASLAFTSYPEEYPLYLRAMGFKKEEIRRLQEGGVISHALKQTAPGEFGLVAANVINVPPYYFRDYYLTIESFRTIRRFQNVGTFNANPGLNDLRPLELTSAEISELQKCTPQACELK